MKKAIIGKKVGMTQIFDEQGKVVPVTVIEAGPCKVVQKKTEEKEGYASVQLGFDEVPERKLNKPEKGHLDKANAGALRVLHEFRLENAPEMNVGDVITADVFAEGDKVDVTGISKGKGYAGVIKRWGAQRTPTTHGGGPVHRHAGSMGSSTDPSRILPGKIGADRHPRRHPRPQGRHRIHPQHREEQRGQTGPDRYQRQPAEGFRPYQPAEGFRPYALRKESMIYA